jgi:hypothetical protein
VDRLAAIREALEALRPEDFDDMNEASDGSERLNGLCRELAERDDPDSWMPLLFALMERLDEVDLGSPGPIVHALERTGVEYHPLLARSVRRKPTPLTVWMVNRILNKDPADRDDWVEILASVEQVPIVSPETVREAREFLAFQRSNGSPSGRRRSSRISPTA